MRPGFLLSVFCVGLCANTAFADMQVAIKRAKAGDFDASEVVQCAQEVGEALRPCDGSVVYDETTAVLVVTFPNGFKRMLMFEDGAFQRGNTTMSGVGTDTDWNLSGGLYRVRVDDQQFEISEAMISGG